MTEDRNPIDAMFAPMVGREIPGGCDDCDAFQTLAPDGVFGDGVWHLTVHHDDTCPTWAAMTGARPNSGPA